MQLRFICPPSYNDSTGTSESQIISNLLLTMGAAILEWLLQRYYKCTITFGKGVHTQSTDCVRKCNRKCKF